MTEALGKFERGRDQLDELIAWAGANVTDKSRNEATTRLHLIDALLFDVLVWDKAEAVAEERFDGAYTDYSLGRPVRRLVVEAKREGVHFILPLGFETRTADLETLFGLGGGIEGAIRQALGYCQERGIPIGAVTNGHQVIAFIGSRQDGVPPLKGRALVFPSLESIKSRFVEFWDNLSPAGVGASTLYSTLGSRPTPPPPEKLSSRIDGYPGFAVPSEEAQDLRILGDLLLEDIGATPDVERDFLEACYASSGALSQYALVSREIVSTRYSLLFKLESEVSTARAANKRGPSQELQASIMATALSRRPILLLGDVGVGKTMFVRRLISVEMRDLIERAIVLYVDFAKQPALSTQVESFILDEFTRQVLRDYGTDIEEDGFVRGVYHQELARFQKGIFGPLRDSDPEKYATEEINFLSEKIHNKAGHLKASLNHASQAQGRQVLMFLDNMDQRSVEFQERLFTIAESFAESWPATVFVALRPETLYESRKSGALSAYQPRVFTISPPRVDRVIEKRLEFALYLLETEGRLPNFPEGLTVGSSQVAEFMRMLLHSFRENDDLPEVIDNLSGGNTRLALTLLETFVGNPHANTRAMLESIQSGSMYVVPLHQFLAAVIYGENRHFYPAASAVANLFDISSPSGQEHFLLPILLAYVERAGRNGSAKEGFVSSQDAYGYLQSLGFQPQQVQFHLNRALDKRLIEPSPRYEEAEPSYFRITTIGAYSVKKLTQSFTYMDAIIVDTPIVDDAVRIQITEERQTLDRLRRCETFRTYLDDQWESLADVKTPFDWLSTSEGLRKDIVRIRRRVETQMAGSRGEQEGLG